jgi:hypothetical protein
MKPPILEKLIRDTFIEMPKASVTELRKACREKIGVLDNAFIDALFEYWFENSYRNYEVLANSDNDVAVLSVVNARERHTPTIQERRERIQQTKEKIETLKNEMLSRLMDHRLAGGELLRFATFGDVAKEGGWLTALSKHGKANEIVGRKLGETDLRNVFKRYHDRDAA